MNSRQTWRSGCRPGALLLLALLLVSSLVLAAARDDWLPWVAKALMVGEDPTQADAILVLGGGTGDRLALGAQLYHEGYAPVLITSGESPRLPGVEASFAELASDYLVTLGIPEDAILMLPDTTSTYDEAVESRALAEAAGLSSLLVVTSEYHSRRSALTFDAAFRGSGIRVTMVTCRDKWWDPDAWWRNEQSLIAIAEEYIKGAYYLVKGFLF